MNIDGTYIGNNKLDNQFTTEYALVKTAETFRNGQDIDTGNVGDKTWGIYKAHICKTINNNIHQGRSCSYLRLYISIDNYVRQFYLSIWIDEVSEQL